MFNKLVRVLERLVSKAIDALFLNNLFSRAGVISEFAGDMVLECSFWTKRLGLASDWLSRLVFSRSDSTRLQAFGDWPKFHPLGLAEYEMSLILTNMGFEFFESSEICDVEDNFYSLNFSKLHPSLDRSDTYYVRSEGCASLLRTHTTSSLCNVLRSVGGEFKKFTIGKVYRNDCSSRHLPCFTQVECIMRTRSLDLAGVVCLIKQIVCEFLDSVPYFRLRSTYFPFTEPSFELDLCGSNSFSTSDIGYGWLEVVGLGLVRSEVLERTCNSFGNVFAWGLGLERLLMLKLKLSDVRRLCNDSLLQSSGRERTWN
ncbi:hypothetical protein AAHH87_00220 [Candidatus Hodgkinia cicadicola]